MRQRIATRAREIERSLSYVISEAARRHKDAIFLTVGEPDFVTPKHILEAGKEALDQGFTHYTGDKGYRPLRELIAQTLKREKGLDVDPDGGVIITDGGSEANFAVIMATVDPGDEVLIPSPYYQPYYTQVRLAGGVPQYMRLREELDFMPDPEEVEGLVTDRTRLMLVNSPSNPTGSVYSRECLEALAKIAVRHDLVVLSDEVYERLVYDDARHYSIATFPGMAERTVITNSFSKTYAMTGWRVGYAAGDENIISQALKIHYPVAISAPSIAQRGAMAALTGSQDCVTQMVEEYDRRRKIIVNGLNTIPGVRCRMPKGAFYAFPNIEEFGLSSLEFAKFLVSEARVATVPGSTYGEDGEGHLRVSYATSAEKLREAVERIRAAVEKLNQ
ncbi:MAG: pyridoxal phosphate-dependent aminotransferase [Candidatus Bathyarchaeia archaeon]